MGKTTFTFRVDESLKDNFARIAKSMDRTGAQLLRDYMRNLIHRQKEAEEHDTWFREQVQTGLNAANTGDLISAEEVEAEAYVWREEIRRKMGSAES